MSVDLIRCRGVSTRPLHIPSAHRFFDGAGIKGRRGTMADDRSAIVGLDAAGLDVRIEGGRRAVPWSSVAAVGAARAKPAPNGDRWILMLVFEFEIDGERQMVVVGEVEPVWVGLTTALDEGLPGIVPFETWGAALATGLAHMDLYNRD